MTDQDSLFPNITTRAERREANRNPEPEFLYQSMGAGVQSTTIALLAANGLIEKPRYAVFSDTGWEPPAVYEHLNRLDAEVLKPSGIELVRVANGNLRQEAVDHSYIRRIPVFTRSANGSRGITKRQCTGHYKLTPIFQWLRLTLGGNSKTNECGYCNGVGERDVPWLVKDTGRTDTTWGTCSVCHKTGQITRIGAAPKGKWARAYVGFSLDEVGRISASEVPYAVNEYPLLDKSLMMSRQDCIDYLAEEGWGTTPKSACIGCPFHVNAEWRRIKADPELWADAIEVDRQIRRRPMQTDEAFLHHSAVPLEIADISTGNDDELGSCSPYGCRNSDPNYLPDVEDALF
jgi:hypothetical protein